MPFSFLAIGLKLFGFLKSIPPKVWLYIALALAYPVLYLYGHHKGFREGELAQQVEYNKASEQAAKKEQEQDKKDQDKAVKDNEELVKQNTQLQISKDQLQKKLNELSKAPKLPSNPACEQPPINELHSLKADIDKANK